MATEEKTLDKLRHLEVLYAQGYRSNVIDKSLDKIIELEWAAAKRDLTRLQERLRALEGQFQMGSEEFDRRFRAGELGDGADFVEWSVFYEMWKSVRERLRVLEAAPA